MSPTLTNAQQAPDVILNQAQQSHHTKLKMSTTQTSFLDLPPELRIMVYSHLLTAIRISRPIGLAHEIEPYSPPAILTVSRVIHLEATPIFYGGTIFYVSLAPCWLAQWLSNMPIHHSKLIKRLRLRAELAKLETGFRIYDIALESKGLHMVKKGVIWLAVKKGDEIWWTPLRYRREVTWTNILGQTENDWAAQP